MAGSAGGHHFADLLSDATGSGRFRRCRRKWRTLFGLVASWPRLRIGLTSGTAEIGVHSSVAGLDRCGGADLLVSRCYCALPPVSSVQSCRSWLVSAFLALLLQPRVSCLA